MGAVAEKIAFPKSRPAGPGRSVIQPALKVGKPNDKYEREAESVADQVMMMPSNPATPLMSASPGGLQMASYEEEELQMTPLSSQISMVHLNAEEDEPIQMSAVEDEEVQMNTDEEESVQLKGGGSAAVSPQLSAQIQQSSGSGAALPPPVQQEMGSKIGRIFRE